MFESEKREAAYLLRVVEDGTLEPVDVKPLYEAADPALVYLLVAWLRNRYPPSHSAAEGVLGRIGALCSISPKVTKMVRTGTSDVIVQWFEETHDYRDFDRDAFISLVVEKLES